jgi:hypothetical protein
MARKLGVLVASYGAIPNYVEVFISFAEAKRAAAVIAKHEGIPLDEAGFPDNRATTGREWEVRVFEAPVQTRSVKGE